MRHIIPISGKDSLATAIVQSTMRPELDYEFMFNPTGLELPEVEEWMARVEHYLRKPIIRVGADLHSIIEAHGYFLPSQRSRYCTRQAKIEPMQAYIGGDLATVYYGIRADEVRAGFNNSTSKNILPAYPLKEKGVNLAMVYAINHSVGLKPPTFFWKSVFERVCEVVPEAHIRSTLTEWEFDALFSWRSRANCDRCYNQQYREWVGLLEHHPDRYWEAESWEHKGSEYTWNSNQKSLRQIAEEAQIHKEKWVKKLIKYLKGGQMELFKGDTVDILQITSCGLLCGK